MSPDLETADIAKSSDSLGIVASMYAYQHDGELFIHTSFGRVIDRLAARFEKVFLCCPVKDEVPSSTRDYRLQAENIEIVGQPFYTSSLGSLKHFLGIRRAYRQVCRKSNCLFLRGMVPFVGDLYISAWLNGCQVCHWIVGNPITLLKSHRRANWLVDTLSMLYAIQDRLWTKFGRWLTNGHFVCNGGELAEIFKSQRTEVVVSSTVTDEEFFERDDTCTNDEIRILFIGFIRPEKGVEYLIEAGTMLRLDKPWRFVLVGPREDFGQYVQKIDRVVQEYQLDDRVDWRGYIPYGPDMFACFKECDIFVLPTLSEGTPRVLVEARANSTPIIATNVGGIPTSVKGEVDGILVEPKDGRAIAKAITRIVTDDAFRRSLIREGLASARRMTVDRFVDTVICLFEQKSKNKQRS